MRVNIYIRKESEAKWESITDKSAWVNGLLHENDVIVNNPKESINKPTIDNITKAVGVSDPLVVSKAVSCKHGYAPELCRYARNGRACKL